MALTRRRARAERATDGGAQQGTLVDTVVALRDELQGLRSAGQLRAVIEQAKGVLVERHHISLDEAFDQLRAMSQEHNVRLVEVAATVVGVTLPHGRGRASPTPRNRCCGAACPRRRRRRRPGGPGPAARRPRRRDDGPDRFGRRGQVSQGDEAAQLLGRRPGSPGGRRRDPVPIGADGRCGWWGSQGFPGTSSARGSSIPPSRDIPYVRSMRRTARTSGGTEPLAWPSSPRSPRRRGRSRLRGHCHDPDPRGRARSWGSWA